MLWDLQFMLQFIGIPYMYQESKNNIFFFSLLTLICLFSYHLHTCWSHLKHNPKTPFQWFIICGLKVRCSHFKKLAFPSGSKTSQAKVKFICDMPYCILPGSTIWKASYENEKDDKFWFCSRMKIVHYSALGIGLYLECLKKLSCSCSLQNSHLQFNSYESYLVLRCTVFPFPRKIDAKLGVHLVVKYFGAALSQCLFMI